MKLQKRIEQAWFGQHKWVWLLLPLSVLFWALTLLRRWLYKLRILPSYHANIPVIVVGNLTVGGNGKTPVVMALVDYFSRQGKQVGVLSRGYGGTCTQFPHVLTRHDNVRLVGDEPWLIFRRTGAKVIIDPKRSRSARLLSESGCDIIISDDGLQHYGLHRDIELVVMDERQMGNGHLLPMGPLRERVSRLHSVEHLILNGDFQSDYTAQQNSVMEIKPTQFININDPSITYDVTDFTQQYQSVVAACAIGNHQRFYTTLKKLGLTLSEQLSFNDHHHYQPHDLPDTVTVVTEKDAVKLSSSASSQWYYLRIDALLPETFYNQIEQSLLSLKNSTTEKQNGL